MQACILCEAPGVRVDLSLGTHPVSTHFPARPDAPERRRPLALGRCKACGVVQLVPPWPAELLRAPYTWITAREPESHLDTVVATILDRLRPAPDTVIAGLTVKDDTTLDRFRHLGFGRVWRVDPATDLGIDDPRAGLETIQMRITPERMAEVAARRGPVDLLVARHILEHAEDPGRFVRGLAALVRPGGVVMVECPDSLANMARHDHTMAWEEHTLYLTPHSFRTLLRPGGFQALDVAVHPFPYENSLVLIARHDPAGGEATPALAEPEEADLFARFCEGLEERAAAFRRRLEREREAGPIALYGAGHLACAFVNHYGLADCIDLVVDDTPQKQGLFLPGARLPIVASDQLAARHVQLCLLCLSVEVEDKVIARHDAFLAHGGRFASIFPGSRRFLLAGAAP